MNFLKNAIREIPVLNRLYMWLRIRFDFIAQYFHDFRMAISYSMPMNEKKGGYRYRVLMLAHFLEKGMSYKNPRPFGVSHVKNIMRLCKYFADAETSSFEYQVAINALFEWAKVFNNNGWKNEPVVDEVINFLKDKVKNDIQIGVRCSADERMNSDPPKFGEGSYLLDRHSVREYASRPLTKPDLEFATSCFRATPTACNRQLCKLYHVTNCDKKELLNLYVPGIGGLSIETLEYFLVTFDMLGIVGAKERNQGFLNAGLAAMSFVTGLHYCNIGSCLLQWDLSGKDDRIITQKLGLPRNERIAVVIAAGHKPEHYLIPISARKSIKDLCKELD